jgi:uncharacterized protein YeaO (DUF488 family)
MRVIIAGCRTFNNYGLLKSKLDKILKDYNDEIIIVSGNANGADKLGEKYGKEKNYEVELYPADWDKHGKSAGPIRNAQMANVGNVLVAFWDGKSSGTGNMIDQATKKGLDVYVVRFDLKGKLYLSNISKINTLPEDCTKLFIALAPIKDMEKYDLHHITKLAPSRELLYDYKGNKIDWPDYVWRYRYEMLQMKPILEKIRNHINNGENIALICYCGSADHCHRGILGNYFKEIGIDVVDLN